MHIFFMECMISVMSVQFVFAAEVGSVGMCAVAAARVAELGC